MEFELKAPEGWAASSRWEEPAPVVRWVSPDGKSKILVHRFGAQSYYATVADFMAGPLAQGADQTPPKRVGEIDLGGQKAALYERVYEELEIAEPEAMDAPAKIKSRKVFREQFAVTEFKECFYVSRFGSSRWQWLWNKRARENLWSQFRFLSPCSVNK